MKNGEAFELLHRGSVKDIYARSSHPDQLLFRFSNRYSIFDWGEMPDAIPYKGKALAEMGRKLLAHLESRGIRTHYLDSSAVAPEEMLVKSVKVPRNHPNAYSERPTNTLIPLEVIYRFGAPQGSSLLRKYKTEKEWRAAGFDRAYREGEDFSEIVLDVTTKLEKMDRPLSTTEAKALAGMNDQEWNNLLTLTKKIATEVRDVFAHAGMKLWDGKLEFAFGEDRSIFLVDTIGMDEIRLTYEGKTLSKELLRQFYLDSSWYQALNTAKEAAPTEFKEYCQNNLKQNPQPLPASFVQAIATVYEMVSAMILNQDAALLQKQKETLSAALSALKTETALKNILVVGSGGREHALAWRISQDIGVGSVFVYPGNPGMKQTPRLSLLTSNEKSGPTFAEAHSLTQEHRISLVIIGPEKFLYEGWVDQFQKNGIAAYGPSQKASFLEESKIRSKVFMRENQIPTAAFAQVNSLEQAFATIDAHPKWRGYVLKLSGPAQGKGVIVTSTATEAQEAAKQFFDHRPPGIEEGMVIEELIRGREVSLFYVCNGENFRFIASACDHKRLLDDDQGPNTGGMGAYSPADWFTQFDQVEKQMVIPTLQAMIKAGTPFTGTLFLGLMVSPDHDLGKNLFLLEYNTRFGDPETQTFLPLLDGNFTELLFAASTSNETLFSASTVQPSAQHAVHVVKAAQGYPGLFGEKIETGRTIQISRTATPHSTTHLFFAGVSEKETQLFTHGGRVLGLTAVAPTLTAARELAYTELEKITFANAHFRKDIGKTS